MNADDLGLSQAVDEGIIVTAERGIVRSASLLVTSPFASAALEATCAVGLSVGLHLNASQPEIVAKAYQPLTRVVFAHMRAGICLQADTIGILLNFFAEQIDVFEQLAGRRPTHVNAHHPLHRIPEFGGIFAEWLEGVGLPSRCIPELANMDVLTPAETVWGFYDKNCLSTNALLDLIEATNGVSIEVVLHPGNHDPDLPSVYRLERALQRDVLCDMQLRDTLQERGFELSDFERFTLD